jgi:addiction module HigA family antidote
LKIIFGSAELARSCNEDRERIRAYGPRLAAALRRRLCDIAAARHLAELRSVPAARLRADPEQADGWLLVALGQLADMRVRPSQEPPPRLSDGRLDEMRIRELLVSDVAVYATPTPPDGDPHDADNDLPPQEVGGPMTLDAEQLEYAPESVSPPGETLKETLKVLGISQADLARRAGLSTKHVNQIIQGMAILSPETSILLERVTGLRAEVWNSLEAQWRTQQQRELESRALKGQLPWLDNFPLPELVARGVLNDEHRSAANLQRVLQFFGVASPQVAEDVWAGNRTTYRRSTTKTPDEYATQFWLRLCVMSARNRHCRPYRREALLELIPQLRALTRLEPGTWLTELPALCTEAGVAVVFEPAMAGTHISAAARWLNPDKALVALSDRFTRIDHFWFAFFHSIGHLLHHGKRLVFLDDDPAEDASESTKEDEANRFAAATLIPPHLDGDYRRLRTYPEPLTNIEAFAARADIAEGIVVGRLQQDGALLPSEGREYLRHVDFRQHA